MKLYFAGKGILIEDLKKTKVKNKLYSYVNDKKEAMSWGEGLMLDSGAFSVLTTGAVVDIDELIEFIKTYKPAEAIQLDVIGDEKKTWENYLYMKSSIPDVLPVIHYKASDEHIKRVLEAADYILLGGLVPLNKRQKLQWLDYLYRTYKLQNKKIHLLGVTSREILERYPAFSCDSSSWLRPRAFGSTSRGVDQKIVSALARIDALTELKKEIEHFLDLEAHITKLWKIRGIEWEH